PPPPPTPNPPPPPNHPPTPPPPPPPPRGEFDVRAVRGVSLNQAAFTEEDLDVYRRAFAQPGAQRAAIEYYRHALPFWRVIADATAPHGERFERLTLKEITAWQREGVESRPYARDYL